MHRAERREKKAREGFKRGEEKKKEKEEICICVGIEAEEGRVSGRQE